MPLSVRVLKHGNKSSSMVFGFLSPGGVQDLVEQSFYHTSLEGEFSGNVFKAGGVKSKDLEVSFQPNHFL